MTQEQQETKKSKILAKIRKVLDQAAGEQRVGNYAAAETFQAKADSLMMEYAIEEAELAFAAPAGSREKPVFRDYGYNEDGHSDLSQHLATVFDNLCRTVGVLRVDWSWRSAKLIGFAADLDYLDLLWTSIKMQMVGELNPSPVLDKTLDENVCMLKEVGRGYEDIFRMLKKAGYFGDNDYYTPQVGYRFKHAYTRYCKAVGKDRMNAQPGVYRRSFLEGYLGRLSSRLRQMKEARGEAAVGHEIVLAGKEEDLAELRWELFPEQRPHPAECECENCHFLRCHDEKCTRPRCVEYNRNKNKPVRHSAAPRDPVQDYAARQMGRAAADRADLSGGRGRIGDERGLR